MKKMHTKLKHQVQAILESLGEIDRNKIPTSKKGKIKFPDFYEVPEVKQVIEELKELGVTTDSLFANGFAAAGMLLRIPKNSCFRDSLLLPGKE